MRYRSLVLFGAVAAVVTVAWVLMAGQAPQDATCATAWTQSRTGWGDPDLQGTWRAITVVPFERPAAYGDRDFLTDAEVAAKVIAIEDAYVRRLRGEVEFRGFRGTPGYNQIFAYREERPRVSRRTSAIVDPPNGQLPPWTLEQVKRYEEREEATRGRSEADTMEDRSASERCILDLTAPAIPNYGLGFGGITDSVSLHAAYGNEKKQIDPSVETAGAEGQTNSSETVIVQSPGYVGMVLSEEFTAPSRVIPLDGRPALGSNVRQMSGSARGRWEENTLVVEITNINYSHPIIPNYGVGGLYPGTGETLRVTERYTCIDADTLEVRRTINDPAVYTRPYTTVEELTREDSFRTNPKLCHEQNGRFMSGILGQARNDEWLSMENAAEAVRHRESWFELRRKQAQEAAKRQGSSR